MARSRGGARPGHARARASSGGSANPIRRVAFAFNDWFERVADRYPRWLAWALDHRAARARRRRASIVVAGMLILPMLGFTWMPDVDGGEFT